jgi:hypothetical protein
MGEAGEGALSMTLNLGYAVNLIFLVFFGLTLAGAPAVIVGKRK